MLNVICLESRDKMLSKEQIFVCALSKILEENLKSFSYANIMVPEDTKTAKYNSLIKYDLSLEEGFFEKFIEENGLAIVYAILVYEQDKEFDDILELKKYLEDILLRAYMLPQIPEKVKVEEMDFYIDKITVSIKNNIKLYYNEIKNDIV